MDFEKWYSSIVKEAAAIIVLCFVAVLGLLAVLKHSLPTSTLYFFLWDLAHQILFYIGGALALVEWFMVKFLDTPLQKRLLTGIVIGLLFVACFQAWVDEHNNSEELIKEKAVLSSQSNFWMGQSYAKDEAIRQMSALLAQNFSTLSGTQQSLSNLSNKILDLSTPKPRIDLFALRIQVPPEQKGLFARHFLVLTNRIVTPLKFRFTCDHVRLYSVEAVILPPGAMMGGTTPVGDEHSFDVDISMPAWTSDNPLVLETVMDSDDAARAGCHVSLTGTLR
jgi:hypothetical protein